MHESKHTHAKLFLTAGAFFSMAAFVLAGLSSLPNLKESTKLTAAALSYVDAHDVLPVALATSSNERVLTGETLLPEDLPIAPGSKMIIADLAQKSIVVIAGTSTIARFPILSIGREGTFWETPSGNYAVRTKEAQHFSSIGHTWMPWSMQFYGNYFIHGWPTHEDGTPVPKGYSGGCIRLDTDDAKKLYELVDVGTTVRVRGAHPPKEVSAHYYMTGSDPLPEIGAKAFIVTDLATGDVLWSRAYDAAVVPGRLSSLMTALVSVETIDQYKWIDYEKFVSGGDVTHADKDNPASLQIGALLYPLVYEGNDIAGQGIASFKGVKSFRKLMNEKSLAIGMQDTVWSGASSADTSTSTVRDLGKLLSYIDSEKSFIMKASMSKMHSFGKNGVERFVWENKEPLLADGEYRGGLVAREDDGSGNAMVTFALPLSEFETRRVGIVVVGAKNAEDSIALIKNTVDERFTFAKTITKK
jgi:hypothetical protein